MMQRKIFGKNFDKDHFSDLRVEIDRGLVPKQATHRQVAQTEASVYNVTSSGMSKRWTQAKLVASNAVESKTLAPSSTRQMQQRCQSQSGVRRKLTYAVERASFGTHQRPHHKLQAPIDALQNSSSASFSRVSIKTLPTCQGTVNRVKENVGVLRLSGKMQKQNEGIAGGRIGPSRSASASVLTTNTSQPSTNAVYQAPSAQMGNYRSSSVQLEVELVERLNKIGDSNLLEKTLSRTRVCQNVLDTIVLHDEHYGRLLSKIRDEFSLYVDITSRKFPAKSNNNEEAQPWFACEQDCFEFALLQEENAVMKKRMNAMQLELDSLRTALRQERTVDLSGNSVCSTGSWPEDDQMQEDDLEDVQIFQADEFKGGHSRPQQVPMLNFASIPLYIEEENDEEG